VPRAANLGVLFAGGVLMVGMMLTARRMMGMALVIVGVAVFVLMRTLVMAVLVVFGVVVVAMGDVILMCTAFMMAFVSSAMFMVIVGVLRMVFDSILVVTVFMTMFMAMFVTVSQDMPSMMLLMVGVLTMMLRITLNIPGHLQDHHAVLQLHVPSHLHRHMLSTRAALFLIGIARLRSDMMSGMHVLMRMFMGMTMRGDMMVMFSSLSIMMSMGDFALVIAIRRRRG